MRAALNLTIFVISLALFGCRDDSAHSTENREKILREIVEEVAPTLPVQVDQATTLYGLRVDRISPATLVYQFRIDRSYDPDSGNLDELIGERERQALNYYCSQPDIEPLRDLGVSFEYNYSARDMTYLFSVVMHPRTCNAQ